MMANNPRPIGRNTAVYLLSSARPVKTPAASHQAAAPPLARRPPAHNVAVQNSSNGVSGVMITAPTPSTSVAFSNAAAVTPPPRPRNSPSPASYKNQEPKPTDPT